jgi:hypothetical protein
MTGPRVGRRLVVVGLASLAAAACSSAPSTPRPAPLPPLATADLDKLVPRAGLVWLVRARPRAIAQIPWLIPGIGRIVPEANFDAFRDKTGFDVRQVPEAYLAGFGPALGGAAGAVIRHNAQPGDLERRFRARLTADVVRAEDRPDVVRLSGKVGLKSRAFARIGADVAVYQDGGEPGAGPARVATLYARGKLAAKRALDGDPLGPLVARFGEAPVVAVALGPFEDEWRRAARGLLESATAVGAAARPTARENIGLAIAITGDWGERGSEAADILRTAWADVATSGTGSILGLNATIEPPVVAGDRDVVTLSAEIAPDRLAEGLRSLAAQDIEALMRLD